MPVPTTMTNNHFISLYRPLSDSDCLVSCSLKRLKRANTSRPSAVRLEARAVSGPSAYNWWFLISHKIPQHHPIESWLGPRDSPATWIIIPNDYWRLFHPMTIINHQEWIALRRSSDLEVTVTRCWLWLWLKLDKMQKARPNSLRIQNIQNSMLNQDRTATSGQNHKINHMCDFK